MPSRKTKETEAIVKDMVKKPSTVTSTKVGRADKKASKKETKAVATSKRTKKEVETLLIHIWSISNSNLILSAKYSNETFKHMNDVYTQEVTETVTALRTTYENQFEKKIQLGDYTAEYERANDYMNRKIEEMLG